MYDATPSAVKHWFNTTFPSLYRCIQPWCLRGAEYNRRCWKHQHIYD